jgi:hypothetical protein
VVGYSVYYDQAGKAQPVDQLGLTTTYDDTGLTNGQLYSYKVTSRYSGCESDYSNILSTTPSGPGASAPGISSFNPTSGPEGTQVTITGASFTGTTSVSFHLTAASSFTVDSDSQIRATVPAGATTGKINVTNANGTGTSATDFTVIVLAPEVSLSPAGLTFGDQDLGATSGAQVVTLSNTGTAALSITSIATTGDFAQTNTCGSSLAAGANCAISVTFTPTATGTRNGTLTITDDAAGSPHTVALSGTGAESFALVMAPGSSVSTAVTAGQTANYTLMLDPGASAEPCRSLARRTSRLRVAPSRRRRSHWMESTRQTPPLAYPRRRGHWRGRRSASRLRVTGTGQNTLCPCWC